MTQPQANRIVSARMPSRSVRAMDRFDDAFNAVLDFEERCRRGEAPSLERCWAELREREAPSVLAGLIKVDLRAAFERGERPAAADYLERFPEVRDAGDHVLSLLYEEYCLLEERGEGPDPESFCARYEPWRDSLASQLRYHRVLSRVVQLPPRRPPEFPAPGEWFAGDRFRLVELLGVGGAARVFLADEPEFSRRVVLKVTPDSDNDREHSIQGRLDHDHIVPVFSIAREPRRGLRGISMPYRPGLPLDEVIRRVDPATRPRHARSLLLAALPTGRVERGRPLPRGWSGFPARGTYADAAAWVVATIARALAHAHERGVVHRDVKPANILLAQSEGPQLLDFNLAKAPSSADGASEARSGGTLPYMDSTQLQAFLDPERWDDVGPASDLFSLGLVLHEMLTGRRPEGPDTSLPLPRAIREMLDLRSRPYPSARSLNPDVPHALSAIVARCLDPAPARRYPDATALAEDLQRYLDHRPLRHAVNPSRLEVTRNWGRRHRISLAFATILPLVLTAAVPVWNAWDNRPKNAPGNVHVARDWLQNGEWDKARPHVRAALRLDPNNFQAIHTQAVLTDHDGDFDLGLQLYEKAIEAARRSNADESKIAEIYLDRARSKLRRGKEVFAALVACKEPKDEPDLEARAEALFLSTLHDTEEVKSMISSIFGDKKYRQHNLFYMLIAAENVSAFARVRMSDISEDRGEPETQLAYLEAARHDLDSALRINPNDRGTLTSKGNVLEEILKLRPEDAAARSQLQELRVARRPSR
jgi:serine/threonine protein kinase